MEKEDVDEGILYPGQKSVSLKKSLLDGSGRAFTYEQSVTVVCLPTGVQQTVLVATGPTVGQSCQVLLYNHQS